MNNRGQTLIIFIILIPLIFLIFVSVIDLGITQKEKIRLYGVTKTIIDSVYDEAENDYETKTKMEELYIKNEIKYERLTVFYKNNKLIVQINSKIDSYFGKFIGLKEYELEISLTGYMVDDKLIIEKG